MRELLLRDYRLVYRVLDSTIDVLRVFEGHRLLPANVTDDEPDEPASR